MKRATLKKYFSLAICFSLIPLPLAESEAQQKKPALSRMPAAASATSPRYAKVLSYEQLKSLTPKQQVVYINGIQALMQDLAKIRGGDLAGTESSYGHLLPRIEFLKLLQGSIEQAHATSCDPPFVMTEMYRNGPRQCILPANGLGGNLRDVCSQAGGVYAGNSSRTIFYCFSRDEYNRQLNAPYREEPSSGPQPLQQGGVQGSPQTPGAARVPGQASPAGAPQLQSTQRVSCNTGLMERSMAQNCAVATNSGNSPKCYCANTVTPRVNGKCQCPREMRLNGKTIKCTDPAKPILCNPLIHGIRTNIRSGELAGAPSTRRGGGPGNADRHLQDMSKYQENRKKRRDEITALEAEQRSNPTAFEADTTKKNRLAELKAAEDDDVPRGRAGFRTASDVEKAKRNPRRNQNEEERNSLAGNCVAASDQDISQRCKSTYGNGDYGTTNERGTTAMELLNLRKGRNIASETEEDGIRDAWNDMKKELDELCSPAYQNRFCRECDSAARSLAHLNRQMGDSHCGFDPTDNTPVLSPQRNPYAPAPARN